jgi:hypothetical protein
VKSLSPIFTLWKLAYYRWARRDLTLTNPMHDDLPLVMRRIAELEAQ